MPNDDKHMSAGEGASEPHSNQFLKDTQRKPLSAVEIKTYAAVSEKLRVFPPEIKMEIFKHAFKFIKTAPVMVRKGTSDFGWVPEDPRMVLYHHWCDEKVVGLQTAQETAEAFYGSAWFDMAIFENLKYFAKSSPTVRYFEPRDYVQKLSLQIRDPPCEDSEVPQYASQCLELLEGMPKLRDVRIYAPPTWKGKQVLELAPTVNGLHKRGVRVGVTLWNESLDSGNERDDFRPTHYIGGTYFWSKDAHWRNEFRRGAAEDEEARNKLQTEMEKEWDEAIDSRGAARTVKLRIQATMAELATKRRHIDSYQRELQRELERLLAEQDRCIATINDTTIHVD